MLTESNVASAVRSSNSSPDAYHVLPSTKEDVAWAASIAAEVYGGVDVISAETMQDWFANNPTGFSTLWFDGKRVGNFDILPLRPESIKLFVEGQVLEKDLPGSSLYLPEEASAVRDLYWESGVLDPSFRGPGRRRMLGVLIHHYKSLFERICPLSQVENMYAVACSNQGTAYLKRLGMSPLGVPGTRLDGHQLFHATLASYAAAIESFLT